MTTLPPTQSESVTIIQRKSQFSKKEKVKLTEFEEDVINLWNAKDSLPPLQKRASKRLTLFQKTVRALRRGTLFARTEFAPYNKKFELDDIKIAVNRFYQAATDQKFLPVDKTFMRSIDLVSFFYNPNFKYSRSFFLHFLRNEPKRRLMLAEEDKKKSCPHMEKALIDTFERYNGMKPSLANSEPDSLALLSIWLKTLWLKLEDEDMWTTSVWSEDRMAGLFFDYLRQTGLYYSEFSNLNQDWILKGFVKFLYQKGKIVIPKGEEDEPPFAPAKEPDSLESVQKRAEKHWDEMLKNVKEEENGAELDWGIKEENSETFEKLTEQIAGEEPQLDSNWEGLMKSFSVSR